MGEIDRREALTKLYTWLEGIWVGDAVVFDNRCDAFLKSLEGKELPEPGEYEVVLFPKLLEADDVRP